uniref:Uncharacterized protein n=1 Tax=Rhizophora mucronata TaxID=61149 RepID=A0A2P2R1K6_RHIMU
MAKWIPDNSRPDTGRSLGFVAPTAKTIASFSS